MDGIHDLGGREGFGPIKVDHDYCAFDHEWEARMYALSQNIGAKDWSIDWFRHMIEVMPPEAYLTQPYFVKWAMCQMTGFVNSGVARVEDFTEPRKGVVPAVAPPVTSLDEILARVRASNRDFSRDYSKAPRFGVGDGVRTLAHGVPGHTRLPGYARDCLGVVQAFHGAHVLPDAMAIGDERAEPLYTVAFSARGLWGDGVAEGDDVMIDLWESYLVSV